MYPIISPVLFFGIVFLRSSSFFLRISKSQNTSCGRAAHRAAAQSESGDIWSSFEYNSKRSSAQINKRNMRKCAEGQTQSRKIKGELLLHT